SIVRTRRTLSTFISTSYKFTNIKRSYTTLSAERKELLFQLQKSVNIEQIKDSYSRLQPSQIVYIEALTALMKFKPRSDEEEQQRDAYFLKVYQDSIDHGYKYLDIPMYRELLWFVGKRIRDNNFSKMPASVSLRQIFEPRKNIFFVPKVQKKKSQSRIAENMERNWGVMRCTVNQPLKSTTQATTPMPSILESYSPRQIDTISRILKQPIHENKDLMKPLIDVYENALHAYGIINVLDNGIYQTCLASCLLNDQFNAASEMKRMSLEAIDEINPKSDVSQDDFNSFKSKQVQKIVNQSLRLISKKMDVINGLLFVVNLDSAEDRFDPESTNEHLKEFEVDIPIHSVSVKRQRALISKSNHITEINQKHLLKVRSQLLYRFLQCSLELFDLILFSKSKASVRVKSKKYIEKIKCTSDKIRKVIKLIDEPDYKLLDDAIKHLVMPILSKLLVRKPNSPKAPNAFSLVQQIFYDMLLGEFKTEMPEMEVEPQLLEGEGLEDDLLDEIEQEQPKKKEIDYVSLEMLWE
ncbi:scpB, partial [Acrasis kona]